MRTPASIAGHPIHPMLVTLPIGLWTFSLACDLWSLFSATADVWRGIAFYTMAGGFAGALLAAVPGVIDLNAIRDDRIRRIGVAHLTINLLVVGAYAVNLWMRARGFEVAGAPMWLSVLSVAAIGVSGWLGGAMVHRYGVGVDTVEAARVTVSTRPGGTQVDTAAAGRR